MTRPVLSPDKDEFNRDWIRTTHRANIKSLPCLKCKFVESYHLVSDEDQGLRSACSEYPLPGGIPEDVIFCEEPCPKRVKISRV